MTTQANSRSTAENRHRHLRHPLCEMTPAFFDGVRNGLAKDRDPGPALEPWKRRIARTEGPTGERGWRALFILGIARDALHKQSAEEVADTFRAVVEPERIAEFAVPMAKVWRWFTALNRSYPRTFLPRKRGRRSEPTVETAVRVWTIDCLCELAALTLGQAIELWNRKFPLYSSASTQFRVQRTRVREHLERDSVPAASQKRGRGRPRKHQGPIDDLLRSL